MEWNPRAFCLIFCLYLGGTLLSAQAPSLDFERLGVEDGLSQTSVNCLLQDSQGFIWVGTNQGLNRYDGYGFRQFLYAPESQRGPSHHQINVILEDRLGHLWVGTSNGLNLYDPRLDKWTYFFPKENDSLSLVHHDIFSLFEDHRGDIWIGTGVGFSRLIREGNTPEDWSFDQYKPSKEPGPFFQPNSSVFGITEDEKGNLWLGITSQLNDGSGLRMGSLVCFNPARDRLTNIEQDTIRPNALRDGEIRDLAFDTENRLWLGSNWAGLIRLIHAEEEQFAYHPLGGETGLPHPFVTSLHAGKEGNLWVGTYGGLACLPAGESEQFALYEWQDEQGQAHNFENVDALLEDRNGNLWVGTETGLFRGRNTQHSFHTLLHQPGETQSLIGGDIFGVLSHSRGEIWVASYNQGLTRLTPDGTGAFRYEQISANSPIAPLPTNSVIHLTEDEQGHIWVGSFGGLMEIIPQAVSGKERQIISHRYEPENPQSPGSNYVYEAVLNQGDMWLANYTIGLEQMKQDSVGWQVHQRMQSMGNQDPFDLPSNELSRLYRDPQGNLWCGLTGFVRLYLGEEGQWGFRQLMVDHHDKKISPLDYFITMYREPGGRIWLGSKNGLWQVELLPEAEIAPWESDSVPSLLEVKTKQYTLADGLPDLTVYGIVPDGRGRLWLSTQKGLSCFDPQKEQFRNYDVRDGLQGDEFNGNSYAQDKRGYLYFGGINGVTYFHPDSLRENFQPPTIALTDVRLFNESLEVGAAIPQSDFLLDTAVSRLRTIRLSHRDYVVSFEFSALDFTQVEKNQYAYQMEGLDEDWVYSGNRRFVTYTNLAPGSYTFRVKASNNDGIWNEAGLAISIVVDPPWWQRWWAWLMYMSLLGLVVYQLIRYRTRKVRQEMRMQARVQEAKVEERERVRAQSSRDFHDEAGNHITKISLYTGLVKRGLGEKPDMEEYLGHIEENLQELSGGMKDFIWALDPQEDGLEAVVQRMVDFGYGLYQHSEIEFIPSVSLPEEMALSLDMAAKRNLLLIFKEAMNNALKYAKASTVRFQALVEGEYLLVRLQDDGLGFDQGKLVRVNGLNNMAKRAEEMGGELTVLATPGLGTSIQLQKQIYPNG